MGTERKGRAGKKYCRKEKRFHVRGPLAEFSWFCRSCILVTGGGNNKGYKEGKKKLEKKTRFGRKNQVFSQGNKQPLPQPKGKGKNQKKIGRSETRS